MNNVHRIGGSYMGMHHVVSKEIILSAAKEIALEEGLNKINIRAVAGKCGISVGSVYNHYPSKSDLLIAIIEDFWKEAFTSIDFKILEERDFYGQIQEIYTSLLDYLQNFRENWLEQISSLSTQEKKLGRKRESHYHDRIHTMIISLMDRDDYIKNKIWSGEITKEKTAKFIFDNMFLMLRRGDRDLGFFIATIKKVIES